MSDLVLAAAGVIVFGLTTWAALVFGYQVFQTMWENDQADTPAPLRSAPDAVVQPVGVAPSDDGDVAGPSEFVDPVAPAA